VCAGAGEAGTADADAVAQRAALTLHQIEHALVGVDDDRARSLAAVVDDLLLHEAGVHGRLSGIVRRFHHARPHVGRIWTIVGGIARRLIARAAQAAEQELEEAAAVFVLRDLSNASRRLGGPSAVHHRHEGSA